MPFDTQIIVKKVYPLIFTLAFWGISIAPILKPDVGITTLGNNFLGHDQLIGNFNALRLKLGDRVFPNVIVGKDGWLFWTGDRSIDDYQGTNPFSKKELAVYQKRFDSVNRQLKQKGIMLLVVLVPDKSTIYPEYMPDQIEKLGSKSRLDQFVDYMRKHGETPIVDLRPDLIAASKTEQVYLKTDSHWNANAYYIAYRDIISNISRRYPELVPHPLSDYRESPAMLTTFDIPRHVLKLPGLKDYWQDLQPRFETGINSIKVTEADGHFVRFAWNRNQNLPSALIVNDSFLNGVVPFLEPHFKQTTSIFRTSIPGTWNMAWVDQAHPNIVIIEFVERYLNYDFFIPGDY